MIRWPLSLVLVCLNFSIGGHAEILDMIPRFAAGQRIHLEISQSREDSAYALANGSNATPVTVVVKAQDENGFVLEVTSGFTQLHNAAQAKLPMVMAANRALEGIPISLRLSRQGQLRQFIDLEASTTRFQETLGELTKGLAAGIQNVEERKKFLDAAPKTIQLPTLLQTLAQEISVWMGFSGYSFDTEKPLKTKTVGPHPIDVGRISSELEITIRELSLERNELIVECHQAYDSNGFAGLLRQLLLQSQIQFRPEGKIPEVNMVDDFEYVFDIAKGWPKRASRRRTTTIAPLLKRTEVITVVVTSVDQ